MASSMPKEMRLSPRCILAAAPSNLIHHRQQHSRQSSLLSNHSSSTTSFLYGSSSARSSTSSLPMALPNQGAKPKRGSMMLALQQPHKVSPTSMDLGYHTMVHNDSPAGETWDDSPMDSICSEENNRTDEDIANVRLDTSKMLAQFKGKQPMRKRNAHNEFSFEQLSDDIIMRIFSKLSTPDLCQCARVCRRFYFLAWDPSLWRSIDLSNAGERLETDEALTQLLLRLMVRDGIDPNDLSLSTTPVERISLAGCTGLSDRGMLVLARHCPALVDLDVRGCHRISDFGITEVVTHCTNLTRLNVAGCPNISTVDLKPSEPCPRTAALGGVPPAPARALVLRVLDLTDCKRLTDDGLAKIAQNSPNLSQLYLRRCVQITDLGVKSIASNCLSLREMSLSDCPNITDFALHELAKLGPNLRYLSVAKCDRISDSGLVQIARLCYKLRYLNVRGCEAVSDSSMATLARSGSRLRSLDVGKCDITDTGLKSIAEACPHLRKLSVKSCEMITDSGIQVIAFHCRGLQQLNIQDCQVTLDGYRTVRKYCKRCIIEHTNPGFF